MKKWVFVSLFMVSSLFAEDRLSLAMDALEMGNFELAVVLFKPLAEEGNFFAQENLGVMYNNGFGVAKNPEIASYWFNKAEESKRASSESEMNSFCTRNGQKGKLMILSRTCSCRPLNSF